MDAKEIAEKLWGWERERIVDLARNKFPPNNIDVAPAKAVPLGLVQVITYANETTGTATVSWELTALGKEVAALLSPPLMSG